ncbi:50S ribosomal protein L29 [Candidatus Walczuchella endosymbiont of Icerya purchasi]|uniref:50S ribosomal protein L29 n=1 Tax=Candidatus Walczuchella endosymbiont of Icerya purchasi TaxID=3066219 RepID=UPI00313F2928
MKASEIINLSIKEISNQIKNKKSEYEILHFNNKISTLKNPLKLRITRKIIARMLTILRKKNT